MGGREIICEVRIELNAGDRKAKQEFKASFSYFK